MRGRTHIVGIGGGTGLSVLLTGLRRHADRGRRWPIDISAIVSVADDGGSTGRLRRDLGIPAVGDLRNCVVALARGNPLWREVLQHRFVEGDGIGGHALGNLVVAALLERSGDLSAALQQLAGLLRLSGRVLPVTEERVTLCARIEGGEVVLGESNIPGRRRRIARVWLHPRKPVPARGVREAIAEADAIVLGPGSLYTSVLPNLLVDGVAEAIREARALRIFVCNLMTEPGESDGFDAAEHVRVLEEYLGRGAVDVCLLNARALPPEVEARYAAAGSTPVRAAAEGGALGGAFPLVADLLPDGPFLCRHDPGKLADAVVSLARSVRRRPRASSLPAPARRDHPASVPAWTEAR